VTQPKVFVARLIPEEGLAMLRGLTAEKELNATYTDLDTLLRESDVVSAHVALTDYPTSKNT